ncbi:glycosyltransferase family A protein [Sphingomonas sp. HF-S3]|uniref:Glycosyltransferase family A protein n=1 Tax=Sphingomonas rustica TaxID=3103142 RepID=A0ABV0B391_9SPHN
MRRLPEVSVVMPVYNGAAYVEAALRSIAAQDMDMEILVHDDGSTDDSLEIVRAFARLDGRLDISTGSNAGPASARNRCLERARGRWIAFLDHDDVWPVGRLRRQVGMLEKNAKAGAVLGHCIMFGSSPDDPASLSSADGRKVLAGFLQAGTFRSEALRALGGLDPDLRAADDLDLYLRLAESNWSLMIDPEIAFHYRLHPGQWTADTRFATSQTVRALHKSISRRRAAHGGVAPPLVVR